MEYLEWKLKLIGVIIIDKVDERTKFAEIDAVLSNAFKDSFEVGDTPEDAWDGEKSSWD